jgi:peptide/nickel transport system permease protein
MNAYAIYAGKRLLQFALVVFIGINLAFVITHSTPIDPVEQTVATATPFGSTSPEAVEMMRRSLRELYGLEGSPWAQYAVFWKRIVVGDFGPSLSAFPTPVSVLINRALPWTIGLLTVSTVAAWILGNLLGGLAGYYRDSKVLRVAGIVAMGIHPIPYYIVAFVLLIVFGYVWPVLPISGGSQMNVQWGWNATFILSVLRHAPCRHFAGPRRHRRLVHGHALARLQHRDRGLRHLRRARGRRPPAHPRAPT